MGESETTAVQISFNFSTDQAFSREAVQWAGKAKMSCLPLGRNVLLGLG
jgi:hypothetical protein